MVDLSIAMLVYQRVSPIRTHEKNLWTPINISRYLKIPQVKSMNLRLTKQWSYYQWQWTIEPYQLDTIVANQYIVNGQTKLPLY